MATTFRTIGPAVTRARPRDASVLALVPSGLELSLLALINLGYLVAGLFEGKVYDFVNLAGPSLLMTVLGAGAVNMLRRSVDLIWTPIFWIRVSSVAYFGVGSIVPYFLNDETRIMIDTFYLTFPADVAHFNLITGSFILILLTVFRWVTLFVAEQSKRPGTYLFNYLPEPSGLGEGPFAAICLGVGMTVRYFVLLPHSFGMATTALPAWLANLAMLSFVGYYLGARFALRIGSPLLYVVLAFSGVDFITGMLEFAKTSALMPLIMVAIAFVEHYRRVWVIALIGVLMAGTYLSIAPVVTYGRTMLGKTNGTVFTGTLDQRWDILTSYSPAAADIEINSDIQGGWARLSYIAAGSFVIDQYDAGRPGSSLNNAWATIVPRVLYPDKPNMTAVGTELSIMINGNENSQVAAGWPPELYWNGGWTYIVLGGILIGAFFSLFSLYAISVIRRHAVHLMLVALLGVRIGTRMDGFIVPDILGTIPIIIVAHLALTFLNRLTFRKG